MRFGKAAPWAVQRVFLAERFHWTLDYVDNLGWEDLLGIYATLEGKEKALDAMHKR